MSADLQKTLAELSELVPIVPLRVSELLEAGDDLLERFEGAVEEMEELPGKAEDLRDEVVQAFEEWRDQAEEMKEEWEEGHQELEEATEELQEALQEASEEIKEAVDEAREHLGRVEANFARDGRLTVAEKESSHSMTAHGTRYLAGQERTHLMRQAFSAAAAACGARLEACTQALGQAFGGLAETIQDLQAQVQEGLAGFSKDLAQAHTELAEKLEILAQQMDTHGAAAVEKATELLHRNTAAAANARLKRTYDNARQNGKLTRAENETVHEQEGRLQPLLDRVSDLIPPVETVLDAVKAAALLVGLNLD